MSKGLEALERNKRRLLNPYYYGIDDALNDTNIIRKELTVLEIIKEKKVDVSYLEKCDSVDEYNLYISNYDNNYWKRQSLDKEEFDTLKRCCNGK